MKHKILFLFVTLLTACTFVSEPIAVTRVVEGTAVPTLTTTPTPPSLPTATATTAVATHTPALATTNRDTPQLADLPTPTPTPPPITPTATAVPAIFDGVTQIAPDAASGTVAPPAGLLYQVGDAWWRTTDEAAELLFVHEGPLLLNPSATLAISYTWPFTRSLSLIHLPANTSEVIDIAEGNILSVGGWLDDTTIVLALGPRDEMITQRTVGTLALWDANSHTIIPLPAPVPVYPQTDITAQGAIAFAAPDNQLYLWQEGEVTPLLPDISLYKVSLSPDGRQLVSIVSGDFGKHTQAYEVFGLEDGKRTLLHAFLPIPTDGSPAAGIFWSPDGRWLALLPYTWEEAEKGLWLVTADGTTKLYFGREATPFWLSADQLAFSVSADNGLRWQVYDLTTGQQQWLDLPPEAMLITLEK